MRVYLSPKVLIVDEFGIWPYDRESATAFFSMVSARCEKGSIIPMSNKGFANWRELLGDTVIATAILDRLLHHSHVINIRGESYRLKDKRQSDLLTSSRLLTSTPEDTQLERKKDEGGTLLTWRKMANFQLGVDTRFTLINTLPLSESMPRIGTGNSREMASSPSTTRDCSRASSGIASVQPEKTSVTTSLLMNEPAMDSPQWATRSISRYPGSGSFQSEKVRTGMRLPIFLFCLRFLRLPACSLIGLSNLSMVEALAANSRCRTPVSRSRCPCLSGDSTILGSAALSLLPHILSDASHTTVSASFTASSVDALALLHSLGESALRLTSET